MRRVPWREAFRPAAAEVSGIRIVAPGGIVTEHAEIALTTRHRMRGLVGRDSFDEGNALVIDRCRQVHMNGVAFPIEAVFCDKDLNVVAIESLQPGERSAKTRGAAYCIEVPVGTSERAGIVAGVQLRFEPL